MIEPNEERKLRRGIRTDLVIAVGALLVSGLATFASLWQSHVVAQQLGAQVWPYVSFNETYDDQHFSLAIENDGLGPAVMRSVLATVDGKPQRNLVDILHALVGPKIVERAKARGGAKVGLDMTSAPAGSVLRAGASVTVFTLTSREFAPRLGMQIGRIRLSACYCSIEGDCWTIDGAHADPVRVSICPLEPLNLMQTAQSVPLDRL